MARYPSEHSDFCSHMCTYILASSHTQLAAALGLLALQGTNGIWVGSILHRLCIVNTILKIFNHSNPCFTSVSAANAFGFWPIPESLRVRQHSCRYRTIHGDSDKLIQLNAA